VFFKGKKEMVAGSHNYHVAFVGNFDIFFSRQRSRPIYLYLILIEGS
jgi:hypothetical protein